MLSRVEAAHHIQTGAEIQDVPLDSGLRRADGRPG
jgi:hypothetical protein